MQKLEMTESSQYGPAEYNINIRDTPIENMERPGTTFQPMLKSLISNNDG